MAVKLDHMINDITCLETVLYYSIVFCCDLNMNYQPVNSLDGHITKNVKLQIVYQIVFFLFVLEILWKCMVCRCWDSLKTVTCKMDVYEILAIVITITGGINRVQ